MLTPPKRWQPATVIELPYCPFVGVDLRPLAGVIPGFDWGIAKRDVDPHGLKCFLQAEIKRDAPFLPKETQLYSDSKSIVLKLPRRAAPISPKLKTFFGWT